MPKKTVKVINKPILRKKRKKAKPRLTIPFRPVEPQKIEMGGHTSAYMALGLGVVTIWLLLYLLST